jgi:putative FmdB family regulatory protein
MPTYVYGCDACGHRFEQFQKFSDEPIRVCPECGKAVRRIFQPAGIVFKGSGWHITDYKRSGNSGDGAGKSGDSAGKGDAARSDGASGEPANGKAAESKSDSASSTTGDSSKPAPAAS